MSVKIREEIVKTDFLIVGGGVAGLQAAMTAAQKGIQVVIAERRIHAVPAAAPMAMTILPATFRNVTAMTLNLSCVR